VQPRVLTNVTGDNEGQTAYLVRYMSTPASLQLTRLVSSSVTPAAGNVHAAFGFFYMRTDKTHNADYYGSRITMASHLAL